MYATVKMDPEEAEALMRAQQARYYWAAMQQAARAANLRTPHLIGDLLERMDRDGRDGERGNNGSEEVGLELGLATGGSSRSCATRGAVRGEEVVATARLRHFANEGEEFHMRERQQQRLVGGAISLARGAIPLHDSRQDPQQQLYYLHPSQAIQGGGQFVSNRPGGTELSQGARQLLELAHHHRSVGALLAGDGRQAMGGSAELHRRGAEVQRSQSFSPEFMYEELSHRGRQHLDQRTAGQLNRGWPPERSASWGGSMQAQSQLPAALPVGLLVTPTVEREQQQSPAHMAQPVRPGTAPRETAPHAMQLFGTVVQAPSSNQIVRSQQQSQSKEGSPRARPPLEAPALPSKNTNGAKMEVEYSARVPVVNQSAQAAEQVGALPHQADRGALVQEARGPGRGEAPAAAPAGSGGSKDSAPPANASSRPKPFLLSPKRSRKRGLQLPTDEARAKKVMAHRASAARSNAKKLAAVERARELEGVLGLFRNLVQAACEQEPRTLRLLLDQSNPSGSRQIMTTLLDPEKQLDDVIAEVRKQVAAPSAEAEEAAAKAKKAPRGRKKRKESE